jgi:hypothetical protein
MSDGARRIGDSEREAAVAALQVHRSAGRLESSEYEERSIQARQARTRADLDPLFADLPQPWPALNGEETPGAPVPSSSGGSSSRSSTPAVPAPVPYPATSPVPEPQRYSGLVPEPWGAWVMSLTPFAALILFFATGYRWQWFLIIPIAGLIVYGPGGKHGGHGHGRDRNRDR